VNAPERADQKEPAVPTVAVLAGGLSLERDVSLRSGRRVAGALADNGHTVARLDLDENLVTSLAQGGFDAAFLCLHGKAGEDGTIQGLLELLGIPYTGPDPTASALAWDKAVAKGMWRRAGLPTPEWIAVSSAAIRDMGAARALDRIVDRLGLPLVVKPSQGGASMGVRIVNAAEDLGGAVVAAFSYHDVVLVERFVAGTEIAVSIIDERALPAVEIVPKDGAYDFAARYTHGATEFFAPARLDDIVTQRCRDVALEAYRSAGCRHVTRADLIVDAQGDPWLLELDTCPGMTETSLLPMAARAEGWDFTELCDRLVRRAIEDGPVRT
jgi:D-alanine-D-alanine ligase